MHEQHPVFEPPTNPDIPIWRYMDMAKFVSMLEEQALHFSRADQMWDKFEGSLSGPSLDFEREEILDGMSDERWAVWRDQMSTANQAIRQHTYLNCWHMNEHESVAMWNMYRNGDASGIAVRSTYRQLADCLGASERERIYIGMVTYIDYLSDEIPWNNGLYPYVHKKMSFEFERELRALFQEEWCIPGVEGQPGQLLPEGSPVIPVSVDLDHLVAEVFVSPRAPRWFGELIRRVVTRYGRDWPVVQSDLDSDPVF